MKNEEILEILERPDVVELLALWDLFCDFCKTTRLEISLGNFLSYLIVLKRRLEDEKRTQNIQ